MNRDAIISRVRSKIDEISQPDDLQLVDDVFAVIDENLEDSTNSFLHKAPLWLTLSHEVPLEGHEIYTDGGGYLILPGDFLRLHTFQMAEWDYPATLAIGEDHPFYKLRKNPYLVSPQRPMVAIKQAGQSKILEYYAIQNSHEIYKARYIKRVDREHNAIINQPEGLIDGLLWQCAADFFIIIQQPEYSRVAESKMNEFIRLNHKAFTSMPETKDND